jgi:hypothetical protein
MLFADERMQSGLDIYQLRICVGIEPENQRFGVECANAIEDQCDRGDILEDFKPAISSARSIAS